MIAAKVIKLSSISHNFLISVKKLRNNMSINDTTIANSKNIHPIEALMTERCKPEIVTPNIQL